MKSIKSIGFIVFMGFALINCSKQNDDCDPDRFCDTLPQDGGDVKIKVTYNGNGIPIIVYNGYADQNDILFYDTLWSEESHILFTAWKKVRRRSLLLRSQLHHYSFGRK